MTEKSECPFVKAHQCAQGVSYYYFWRCVGHWLNYKSFFGEGKTILNFILFFTKWIFQITPSRFPPNVQEIIFQMVLSSSTKYILLMELKETQLMHIPCMCFFFLSPLSVKIKISNSLLKTHQLKWTSFIISKISSH